MRFASSFLSGLIFGLGLAVSNMTVPAKVLNFLDVAGNWDPSLLLVLGGAVGVATIAFRLVLKHPRPVFAERFDLSTQTRIDTRLLIGAVIFGVGWGISGYCPGPAIATLWAPDWETLVFVPAMLVGAVLQRIIVSADRRIDVAST
jgi:uncharacterized membrane protein YedE/YeeE